MGSVAVRPWCRPGRRRRRRRPGIGCAETLLSRSWHTGLTARHGRAFRRQARAAEADQAYPHTHAYANHPVTAARRQVLFFEPEAESFWTAEGPAERRTYVRLPATTFPLSLIAAQLGAVHYPPHPGCSYTDRELADLRALGRRFLGDDLPLECLLGLPLVHQGRCVCVLLLVNKHNASGPFERRTLQVGPGERHRHRRQHSRRRRLCGPFRVVGCWGRRRWAGGDSNAST